MSKPIHAEKWKSKQREYIKLLRSKPCTDCGQIFPWYIMEFDHARGSKEFGIAEVGSRGIGKKRLQEELLKCDLVCGNCHNARTYFRKMASK